MTNPSDTRSATGIQHRKPRAGERTRGAVDAMQTKFAVGGSVEPVRKKHGLL